MRGEGDLMVFPCGEALISRRPASSLPLNITLFKDNLGWGGGAGLVLHRLDRFVTGSCLAYIVVLSAAAPAFCRCAEP